MNEDLRFIKNCLQYFEEPNDLNCLRLLEDREELFLQAPGSRANHQAYPGGYLRHVAETMDMARSMFVAFGTRFEDIPENEQFWIRDAQLVMFLHDLEKPWKYGEFPHLKLQTKQERHMFRRQLIHEYEIKLSPSHIIALDQVEGIRDEDYSPDRRGFTPLGAFCHTLDLLSSRVFYT